MHAVIHTVLTPELEKPWTALWRASSGATLFNSPAWLRAFMESSPPAGLTILVVHNGSQLTAVLPLVDSRLFGLRVLQTPAADFAQRSGLLIDLNDTASLRCLYQELQLLGPVCLGHLTAAEIAAFTSIGAKLSVIGQSVSPRLSLAPGPSGKFVLSKRSQILKKAREDEPFLELVSQTGRQEAALDQVFTIDDHSTKQLYKYNVFQHLPARRFFLSLARHAPQLLGIYLLNYRGVPVAYEIGFSDPESTTYLDSERAYLVGQEAYTPGKVLLVKLAESLAAAGFGVLDLGPGEDNLKRALSSDREQFTTCLLAGSTWAGSYLARITVLREAVYNWLFAHPKLYSLYRRLKP